MILIHSFFYFVTFLLFILILFRIFLFVPFHLFICNSLYFIFIAFILKCFILSLHFNDFYFF